jgi:aryl-alcohol dehydrogenase-like predicted oxidoreductase
MAQNSNENVCPVSSARRRVAYARPPMGTTDMQYVRLGRSGVKVSRLCLGTMNFGVHTNETDSFQVMDRALEVGINFFDTANVYGQPLDAWGKLPKEGLTEQIIGRWLAQGQGRRERVLLATKVFGGMYDGPNGRGLSAYHIRRACDDSLRRLKTDRIDLYQMHHVDRETPWDEIWQAIEILVQQGKVLYVGSSNFAAWHIAQACERAVARHFLGLISEQSLYHLGERTIELEVLPACRAYGLGVIPWSPLGGGMLGGALRKADEGRRAGAHIQERIVRNRERLEKYEALCNEIGQSPATVALSWLLHQPGVSAPIIGPRTGEQLESALSAVELVLEQETLAALDSIWPGPGGAAPEAYAW